MITYTSDALNLIQIQNNLKPLFLEKETLKNQIDNYNLQLKEKFDATVLKTITSLNNLKDPIQIALLHKTLDAQLKEFQTNVSVMEYRQFLTILYNELKNVNSLITVEESKIDMSIMFDFEDSMKEMLSNMIAYFDESISFETLMDYISNNEYLTIIEDTNN